MSASKKRRLEHQEAVETTYTDSFLADVQADVQLEIALRERLADTLESRILWAVTLQESLQNANGGSTADAFRSVALDALEAMDSSSDFILSHEPLAPPSVNAPPRPLPRKAVPANTVKPRPSFLFIRSSSPLGTTDGSGHQNDLYLLKCTACSRTKFTSLQGLLNHARLAHNLEWGTHDECIGACAVLDNNLDVTLGNEVGLGPMGVLPGLRSIFQMAVGAHSIADEIKQSRDDTVGILNPSSPLLATTGHLNQTLGLHEETSALAPFLGKEPIRRQIKVVDEDDEVDIEGLKSGTSRGEPIIRRWRMPFAPRNFPQVPSPESIDALELYENKTLTNEATLEHADGVPSSEPPRPSVSAQSRFHLVTRIIITDRNLWMPPARRPPDYTNYTHKWMISIDSPSYTHHITSILNSVQVTASDPQLSFPSPPVTTAPPFVVVGVADRPFLARIELSFSGWRSLVGESPEQRFVFHHWVDLYPAHLHLDLNALGAVKGEDQILDIDLDKNTILKPIQLKYTPVESKTHWNQVFQQMSVQKRQRTTQENLLPPDDTLEGYETKLSSLLKSFPMTLEDFKGKRSKLPTLPYLLASSPEHFNTFVMGRRKAIEWGRARAIRDAYDEILVNSSGHELIPLSVGQVYAWLSKNGHFPRDLPRSSSAVVEKEESARNVDDATRLEEEVQPQWCRICGLEMAIHHRVNAVKNNVIKEDIKKEAVKKEAVKKEDPEVEQKRLAEGLDVKPSRIPMTNISSSDCPFVPKELQISRLPRLNINRMLLETPRAAQIPPIGLTGMHDCGRLLAAADPNVTLAIHRLTNLWCLPTFHPPRKPAPLEHPQVMPLDMYGGTRKEVEKTLAPHALLALVAERFIRALVDRGLEVAHRNEMTSAGMLPSSTKKRSINQPEPIASTRLLTPTHILSGILTREQGSGASRDPLDAVLLMSLSKLGVAVEENTPEQSSPASIRVKLEEESL